MLTYEAARSDLVLLEKSILVLLAQADSVQTLDMIKATELGNNSRLSSFLKLIPTFEGLEKQLFGKQINEIKNRLLESYIMKRDELLKQEISKKLEQESINVTLPAFQKTAANPNPFYQIRDELETIFVSLGYQVVTGSEVEDDYHNFELLNIPKHHPARDMQDSFYFDATNLLRTHTSNIQTRVMMEHKNQPLRIISSGKTYRRDNDDLTHSHQFAQIEGLVIDKNISMADLKGTLEYFLKRLFGAERKIRLRGSYFPFTEPSVEVDISCAACGGKGCPMCKGTGYIEILGAGMVHPNVLKMCGYDETKYSGFAFGIGIERLTMLKYGIDDIRRFYQNDLRFLKQFKKRSR
jgi:phenylalanyl-tRNA synthetase alpha chain